MIVNLTPHPIHIYAPSTPDRIQVGGEHAPVLTFEPSGHLARLGGDPAGGMAIESGGTWIPVDSINYGSVNGLPPYDAEAFDSPDDAPRTYYIVSLVVVLGSRGRSDLLSPYREVRNLEGSVLGCRALARPVWTGWDRFGHAVKTGLPVDRYLGQGDLQDAENCGYAPVSVLAELEVDVSLDDPQIQFRDGRIVLVDGTVLTRGGTLNCVWAVTGLPRYAEPVVQRGPA